MEPLSQRMSMMTMVTSPKRVMLSRIGSRKTRTQTRRTRVRRPSKMTMLRVLPKINLMSLNRKLRSRRRKLIKRKQR